MDTRTIFCSNSPGQVKSMSDVTMERRLQLVKQIRSRYNEDQYDLSNRERILYGRSSRPAENFSEMEEDAAWDAPVSFFRIRLVVAIILLAAVIAIDLNGTKIAGITAEDIFRAISADYGNMIDSWMNNS